MKTLPVAVWMLVALALSACVTVNIYFPAAAAEDAARTIVRDVLGAPEEVPRQQPGDAAPGPGSRYDGAAIRWAGQVLEVLVPAAHAQQPDISIRSPAIDALRQSMRARSAELQPHYRSGAVGFTREGTVAIRDLNAVPLRDRATVQRLVADENNDRTALYREIARANGHPEWERDIRDTFARVWVEEAPSGYWYQDAGGAWQQK
ncbi:YdbL family protein [Thioalkalivibrio thiocyanodenitrificans]|uniref:YdbL family protein n=1 Tax=Thioalkalivibrio thiocyanodenitrificans TaxID=243063 RepID=UPI000369D620|nr:YdbL family protein [Thioalkalivibrio thiocyanodenitrificans]